MAWSIGSNVTAGSVLTASRYNQDVIANLTELAPFFSAWTDFVPTLSSGWALGNSTYTAKYSKIGRRVAFYVEISVGSTATKGTTLTAALPVTAASSLAYINVSAACVDTGTAFYNLGTAPSASPTTTIELGAMTAGGTYVGFAGITATVPFTWATNDKIIYGGFYEAAS